MEFKSLRNIESSFRQIRLFGIVFLSLCAVVTVWSVWSSYRFAEKQREKIYVLDNGKSLMLALSQDLSQNRPAEAREHVRRFHEMFFTLSPEKSAIEHNVKRALLLADKSVYHYYSDFAEKGYYNRIIAGNINQVLKVDSVVCDGEDGTLYDLSALERKDKYELFLGGNYGQCVITTGTENGKHLLLVKDSFANSFVPFLTGDYETITMLDLRYFRGSVQELAAEADDILVLTEITNLAASGEYFKLGK